MLLSPVSTNCIHSAPAALSMASASVPLNRLRAFENEKTIANANLSILTKKKLGVIKRREFLKKELEEFNKSASKRQDRADSRKIVM